METLVLAFHLSSALTLALITASRLLNGASLGSRSMCSRHKCTGKREPRPLWDGEEPGVTSASHRRLNAHFASVSPSPNGGEPGTDPSSSRDVGKTPVNVP